MINFEGWCYKKILLILKLFLKKLFGEYLYRKDYL